MKARIGLFDSGVGGLSVWRELIATTPEATTLYIADQAHVPYGPRPVAEVRQFAAAMTRFLLTHGTDIMVLASNSTSTAALHWLRRMFPEVVFVGMEPAVKPAALRTRTGVVGVMATTLTAQGDPLASLVSRFGDRVQILTQPCSGLVDAIEAGEIDTPATEALLRRLLKPLVDANIDQLVLGCTHYPFVRDTIARIVGPHIAVVDPAPAVARHVARLLTERLQHNATDAEPQSTTFFTTGSSERFVASLAKLVPNVGATSPTVRGLSWSEGELVPCA